MEDSKYSEIRKRVKEIFDSLEKHNISNDEKNRVALGLLELEAFAELFFDLGIDYAVKQNDKSRME